MKNANYKINILYLFNKNYMWARVPGARVTRPLYYLVAYKLCGQTVS